ncbi:CLUMA_CG008827, isoform A [Clunio marinus]|uniref:CLUMA_CG008827, isoform A n=1 Tax=Clunio marinus TaxID=568069 RepID=A0A1J1I6N4_9DIPT|nr:CLUMA_CG008827, isoform A [Clunio marinus]
MPLQESSYLKDLLSVRDSWVCIKERAFLTHKRRQILEKDVVKLLDVIMLRATKINKGPT